MAVDAASAPAKADVSDSLPARSGCELAAKDGRERIYIIEPTGGWFNDPNLTDRKFPRQSMRSYRSRTAVYRRRYRKPAPHPPEALHRMKQNRVQITD